MIIQKGDGRPSSVEIASVITQIYEGLLAFLRIGGGDCIIGSIANWKDERLLRKVKHMEFRVSEAIKPVSPLWAVKLPDQRHSDFSHTERRDAELFYGCGQLTDSDLIAYKSFQRLKLKAILLLHDEYSKIIGKVGDDLIAVKRMLDFIQFLGKEKLAIAKAINAVHI